MLPVHSSVESLQIEVTTAVPEADQAIQQALTADREAVLARDATTLWPSTSTTANGTANSRANRSYVSNC